MIARTGVAAGVLAWLASPSAHAQPRTLQEALGATYSNNPTLQAGRAQLRATDEGVPQALAGWRPTVTVTGSTGGASGTQYQQGDLLGRSVNQKSSQGRNLNTVQVTANQPLYSGGHTTASTHKAENQVLAARAQLIATEVQVFSNAVQAYVNVIQSQQVLALDINNEQVLTRQLQATNDRFRVGEITRTDVAQAEAALAQAVATRQTAEGTLQTARATYQQVIGEPPANLIEPQPLKLPSKSDEEAKALAGVNNPSVIQALFTASAAKDQFDVAYSQIMPNLSLQGSAFRLYNQQQKGLTSEGATALLTLSLPIYQGGSEYAAIRQARQQEQQSRRELDAARRSAVQQADSSWQTYVAAKATIDSTRSAIRANEIALEGTEREAIVGSRTTLDVLNAQQTLLNSRVTLVQNLASLVNASYQVAAAVGRLTARDLNLQVPLYDERAYYNAVRDRWIGTGDFATEQPGR